MLPLISVIIPIYNTGKFLRTCLTSVINQTYTNLEILCVNDGSKDSDVAEILAEFAAYDSRIVVIEKQNAGQTMARKTGIEHATSDWIIHIDSDDYWELDCVEILYNKIAETGADSCVMKFSFDYPDGRREPLKYQYKAEYDNGKEFFYEQYFGCSVCCMWQSLHKKSLYNEFTIFDPSVRFGEDFLSSLSMYWFAGKVVTVDKVLYHYIQRDGSIMHRASQRIKTDSYNLAMDLTNNFIARHAKTPDELLFCDKMNLSLSSQYIMYGCEDGITELCLKAQRIVDQHPEFKGIISYRPARKLIKLYTLYPFLGKLFRLYYLKKGKIKLT